VATELTVAAVSRLDLIRLDAWRFDAACRGMDADEIDRVFFPRRGDDSLEAKRICFVCPVKGECLDFALRQFIKVGIWGGRSERERRRMRKDRRQAVRAGRPLPAVDPISEPPTVFRRCGPRGRTVAKDPVSCAIREQRRQRLSEVA